MTLTNQQREIFVKLIDCGKNTFADIHREFPFLSREDLINLIGNDFSGNDLLSKARFLIDKPDVLIFFEKVPDYFSKDYQFNASDAFSLSIKGKNILYSIQKEEASSQKTDESIKWAKYATWFSAASVIVTLAIGIISVYISLSH